MLIESLIRRSKGTNVLLGDVTYHFAPRTRDGAHVADVDDDAHIQTLLAVTHGFREVQAGTEPEGAETPNASHVLQGNGGAVEAGGVDTSPAAPRKPRKPRKPKSSE